MSKIISLAALAFVLYAGAVTIFEASTCYGSYWRERGYYFKLNFSGCRVSRDGLIWLPANRFFELPEPEAASEAEDEDDSGDDGYGVTYGAEQTPDDSSDSGIVAALRRT